MTDLRKDYLKFFSKNLLQGALAFIGILVLFILFRNFVQEHYFAWVAPIKDQPFLVYSFFFVNELIVGFIPPEFFMFLHIEDPPSVFWGYVTLMVIISYVGGLLSYAFGRLTERSRFMRHILTRPRLRPLISYYNKYGGVVIFIAAITPIPFALTSLLSGALGYPFKSYIKYAALRFLRFYPYAALVYYVGTVDFSEIFKTLF